MEKAKGKDDNPSPERPEQGKQLADKYRVSWKQASVAQRKALCRRFGVSYTHDDDEALLRTVATKQQECYIRTKQARQAELEKMQKTA